MKFQETFVALVRPFKEGNINETRIRELVRFRIENGPKRVSCHAGRPHLHVTMDFQFMLR